MNKLDAAQANCTSLHVTAPVELLKKDAPETGNSFLIQAYTGAIVERWWGKLAIDIDGITARQQIPIFLNHDPGQIVGYSMNTRKDSAFWVEGMFSGATEEAKKAKALASEGFPWQASIGVRAKKVIQLPDEKSTHEVNGQVVTGPAEVWLESEVFETSFVPLGADSNTSIATFSKFEEKEAPIVGAEHINQKSEDVMEKITLEKLQKDAPELLDSLVKDAEKKGYAEGFTAGVDNGTKEGLKAGIIEGAEMERKRIQSVLAQTLPGHEALIEKLAFDGKTSGPEAAVKVLAAEKQSMKTAKENLESDAISPVTETLAPETNAPVEITEENFKTHKDLVEEFGSFGVYEAYNNAMKQGIVKITGGKK